MKNSWLIWIFVVAVVVTVIVAFNYQGGQPNKPLSEIFPEDEAYPVDVEYEFVNEEMKPKEDPASIAATAQQAAQTAQTAQVKAQEISQATTVAVTTAAAQPSTATAAISDSSTTTAATPILSQEEATRIAYTIQIASFKEKSRSDKVLADALKKNHQAYQISRNLGEKGTWYRVYVGKFDSKAQAQEALASVQKDFKDGFIIAPKK